ncbi:unnamed protein product [Euphydryas editha]|uniref:RRM domain-containing protein n=1 Tax=Euphydryas editha TaxID=104508 RepID=A0AAU9TIV7_EUPED|nr:unnamed protein product [Euphydryas editha]
MVTRTKKIFVGGLSAPTTLEDVKNYFEQFGPVRRYRRQCVRDLFYSSFPYVRAFQMQTVSEYQMSHLNTEHNDYAHLKQRPRGRMHATPS